MACFANPTCEAEDQVRYRSELVRMKITSGQARDDLGFGIHLGVKAWATPVC